MNKKKYISPSLSSLFVMKDLLYLSGDIPLGAQEDFREDIF